MHLRRRDPAGSASPSPREGRFLLLAMAILVLAIAGFAGVLVSLIWQ